MQEEGKINVDKELVYGNTLASRNKTLLGISGKVLIEDSVSGGVWRPEHMGPHPLDVEFGLFRKNLGKLWNHLKWESKVT